MRKISVLYVLLAGVMPLQVGCVGRAINEGMGAVRGGKGTYEVVRPINADLVRYTQFRVERFTDETSGMVPQEVKSSLPAFVQKALAEKKIVEDLSGPAVIIRGRYLYYEDASKVTSEVFGPFEEVVARVELVDASTGTVLGEALCVGRSTATVTKGPESKTEGLAKAISDWIARNRR